MASHFFSLFPLLLPRWFALQRDPAWKIQNKTWNDWISCNWNETLTAKNNGRLSLSLLSDRLEVFVHSSFLDFSVLCLWQCRSGTTPNTGIELDNGVFLHGDVHLEGVSSFSSSFLTLCCDSEFYIYFKFVWLLLSENSFGVFCGCCCDSSNPSFTPRACSFSQFCTAAMEHSAAVVREAAVRILLSVYRQHGAAVIAYLPPKDAAARKNFLYKALFNEFAKIDGKLVATQVRISHPALMYK